MTEWYDILVAKYGASDAQESDLTRFFYFMPC